MLVCDWCGAVFDGEECKVEYEEYGKSINVCPHCKGDEISHAFYCDVCETYQGLGQTSPTDDVCKTCFHDVIDELRQYARTAFTGQKLTFVNELINEMEE